MRADYEYEAASVDEALKKAAKDLDLPVNKIKHDIISYGSSGIFGLVGTRKAKIRVRMPKKKLEKTERLTTEKEPSQNCNEGSETVQSLVENTFSKDESSIVDIDAVAARCRESIQRIVDAITENATVVIKESSNEQILLHVEGGNSAVLIGKRGQTLEALQYLVEKMVNKDFDKRIRLEVDVEGYLKNRNENLINVANRVAEKVRKSGKPMTVGQMNAHDRRVVHLALKDDNTIRTQSKGDGLKRKLMIFPKKNSSKNKTTT